MNRYLIWLGIIQWFICIDTQAQLPSADQSQMVQNINIPVNLYNGVSTVGVPIYNVTSGNGQVPVALQYNTSGIKVNQAASSVGLGWSLVAGGSITRVVRGKPDMETERVNTTSQSGFNMFDSILNDYDGETDLYYFSFPGASGKFIMYDQGVDPISGWKTFDYVPLQIPWQGLSIFWVDTLALTEGFYIEDPGGNQYFFGTKPESRETSVINSTSDGTYILADEISYVSTWHLDSIAYFNQPASKSITFSYVSGEEITEELSQHIKSVQLQCDGEFQEVTNRELKTKTETTPKFISQIDFPTGTVNFQYNDTLREDLPGALNLINIHVKDTVGNQVLYYDLSKDYFDANDSFFKNDTYVDQNTTCYTADCKRLKFVSINMNGKFYRSFDYTNDKSFHSTYGYDEYELPPRGSYYTDHWGYFTGNSSDTTYQAFPYTPLIGINGNGIFDGMNKNPNIYASAGSLNKIIYPTGGYTLLEYGAHTDGGGLRIEAVEQYDERDSLVAETGYSYFDDENLEYPRYSLYTSTDEGFLCTDSLGNPVFSGLDRHLIYSSSYVDLFDFNGSNIGYDRVRETNELIGGYIDHFFLNFSDRMDSAAYKYKYTMEYSDSTGTQGDNIWQYAAPFTGNFVEYYDRGAEYKTEVYDDLDTILSRSESYWGIGTEIARQKNYVVFDPVLTLEWNNSEMKYDSLIRLKISEYDIVSRPVQLDSTYQTVFEDSESSTTITRYSYHEDHINSPDTLLVTLPDSSEIRTVMRYSNDILTGSPTNPSDELDALDEFELFGDISGINGLPVPIETISQYRTGPGDPFEVTNVVYNSYKYHDNFISPYKGYSLAVGEPIIDYDSVHLNGTNTDLVIDSRLRNISTTVFDSNGNLISESGTDGITQTYTYDSTGNYLMSKANGDFVTSYEYIPLVGVKESTSTSDRISYYEYDHFNRLQMVKDHEGNIVERYRYHFINQFDSLGGSIDYTGLNQPGDTMTFFNPLAASFYGETRFIWDFGDGTVAETMDLSIKHAYASSGFYKITLSMINPEYEPQQVVYHSFYVSNSGITCDISSFASTYCSGTDKFNTKDGDYGDNNSDTSEFRAVGYGGFCNDSLTYDWQYKEVADTVWNSMGTVDDIETGNTIETTFAIPSVISDAVSIPLNDSIVYDIRMVMTDECDIEHVSEVFEYILYGAGVCPPVPPEEE